jgi:hypothetical protein
LRNALLTLPSHSDRLKVITLAARGFIINVDILAPIDAVLTGLRLPALTRVEVSVARLHPNYDSSAVVPAFKEMHARGVMVVQHDRGTRWFIVFLSFTRILLLKRILPAIPSALVPTYTDFKRQNGSKNSGIG